MTLDELKAAVTEEWTVDIRDLDALCDWREGCAIEDVTPEGFTIRPKRAWASQGRGFPTRRFTWDGDVEVMDTTARLFRVATGTTSRSRAGVRQHVATYRFHAPDAQGWKRRY